MILDNNLKNLKKDLPTLRLRFLQDFWAGQHYNHVKQQFYNSTAEEE